MSNPSPFPTALSAKLKKKTDLQFHQYLAMQEATHVNIMSNVCNNMKLKKYHFELMGAISPFTL